MTILLISEVNSNICSRPSSPRSQGRIGFIRCGHLNFRELHSLFEKNGSSEESATSCRGVAVVNVLCAVGYIVNEGEKHHGCAFSNRTEISCLFLQVSFYRGRGEKECLPSIIIHLPVRGTAGSTCLTTHRTLCSDSACSLAETSHLFHSKPKPPNINHAS
jgi:hypothetical protein